MKIFLTIAAIFSSFFTSWAEPVRLFEEQVSEHGYVFILTTYENDMPSEAYWNFSTLTVEDGTGRQIDHHAKLYASSKLKVLEVLGAPVLFFSKIGGSGGGSGVYRYQPKTKQLDFFEGNQKLGFPSFSEIFKYEDVDADGVPELFAVSRSYGPKSFAHYWTIYKWDIDKDLPYIGTGEAFQRIYSSLANERLATLDKVEGLVAELQIAANYALKSKNKKIQCAVQKEVKKLDKSINKYIREVLEIPCL